jgi:hypothetical protein
MTNVTQNSRKRLWENETTEAPDNESGAGNLFFTPIESIAPLRLQEHTPF